MQVLGSWSTDMIVPPTELEEEQVPGSFDVHVQETLGYTILFDLHVCQNEGNTMSGTVTGTRSSTKNSVPQTYVRHTCTHFTSEHTYM